MGGVLHFAKGHGTLNDFVLLSDPDDDLDLSDDTVRFLCDRRGGIGGDGVLRAVRARHIAGWQGEAEVWFMDYRNADGSLAEMCGNGLRVFLTFLREEGLVDADADEIVVGTRAGVRSGTFVAGGVRVWLGRPEVGDADVTVQVGARSWSARGVDVGNPHAVSFVESGGELAALDLVQAPAWTPASRFPHGVNLEFVEVIEPRHLRMRVHERGVGETSSCGTGTVAAASAWVARAGLSDGPVVVDVPGGRVEVDLHGGEAWLTGPAVIVARGVVRLPEELRAHE